MNRRGFIQLLIPALAVPGMLLPKRTTFFLPPPGGWPLADVHPAITFLRSNDEYSILPFANAYAKYLEDVQRAFPNMRIGVPISWSIPDHLL